MVANEAHTRDILRIRVAQKTKTRYDREMHPGDDKQVKRASALKPYANAMTQIGAVTCHHRGQHRGIFLRQPEHLWQARDS